MVLVVEFHCNFEIYAKRLVLRFPTYKCHLKKKKKKKVGARPRHQEEEDTDKIKQAQIEQTYLNSLPYFRTNGRISLRLKG